MHLLLTTSFDVADLDGASPYTVMKIVRFSERPEDKVISMICQLGNVPGAVWTPGICAPGAYEISGTEYDTFVLEAQVGEETLHDGYVRELYQWLLDKSNYAGTIV